MTASADITAWLVPVVLVGVCVLSTLVTVATAPGFDVRGKHVLITGATKGIGLAVAKRYARAGAMVSLIGRSMERLETARSALQLAATSDVPICLIEGDVTVFADMRRAVDTANAFHGRVTDHVVCAATIAPRGWFVNTDVAMMQRIMEVNYHGAVNVIKSALPTMVEKDVRGQIVLMNSIAAIAPGVDSVIHSGPMFAVRGFSEALRNELRLYRISVSVFCPGTFTSSYPSLGQQTEAPLTSPPHGDATPMADYTTFIDSSPAPARDDELAQELIRGVRAGSFLITNSISGWATRVLANGVVPRQNTPLEFLVAPILVVGETIRQSLKRSPSSAQREAATRRASEW